jgi:hypothetical protein
MRLLYLICFTFLCFAAWSQSEYQQDAAVWAHVSLNKSFTKKLSSEVRFQQRIKENVSRFDRSAINLNIRYKLAKGIRLEAAYGFISNKRLDETNSFRHRLRMGLTIEKQWQQFELSFRSLSQWRYTDVLSDEEGLTPQWIFRNRFQVKYDINRMISPYVSIETFAPLNRHFSRSLTKYRSQIGLQYHLNNQTAFEIFYLLQQQLRSNNSSRQDHVYGIGLNLKL